MAANVCLLMDLSSVCVCNVICVVDCDLPMAN
jgi:hypothetical protein